VLGAHAATRGAADARAAARARASAAPPAACGQQNI